MEINTNVEIKENFSCINKSPLDVRIVSYFIFAVSLLMLVCSALLITGIGRLGPRQIQQVFFGTISLSSGLSFAIYMICTGFLKLLCAWGLLRCIKSAWWLMFIYCLYEIVDMIFLYSYDELNASVGLIINIVIIVWLIFRRQLYNVGF
jgi:hypothetical protein